MSPLIDWAQTKDDPVLSINITFLLDTKMQMQLRETCIRPTPWLSHHAHNPLPSTLLKAKLGDLWNWKSRQMALLVPGIVSRASLHLACSKDEVSWHCKSMDNVCLVTDVWNNLCKKLNHGLALVPLYCHHICKHKLYHSYTGPVTFMPLLFNLFQHNNSSVDNNDNFS